MLRWVQIEKFVKEMDEELEHEASAIDKKLTYGNFIKNWGETFYVFGGTREGTEFEKTIVVHGYFLETIPNFKKSLQNVVKIQENLVKKEKFMKILENLKLYQVFWNVL